MIRDFYLSNDGANFNITVSIDEDYSSFVLRCNGMVILTSSSLGFKYTKSFKFPVDMPDYNSLFTLNVTYKDKRCESKVIDINSIYDSEEFNDTFKTDLELGAIYTKMSTTFRVWSPVSSKIELLLKDKRYEMKRNGGVFEIVVDGDLDNMPYNYIVTNSKYKDQITTDPYSKKVTDDGKRSIVVDLNKSNPDGWDDLTIPYTKDEDLVIYESHIADLTSHPTWNGKNPKTFKGFYEEGTRYNGLKTGFDHIKELGVNRVQIMPINDAYNFYDSNGELLYNWNYNPRHYNALNNIFGDIKDFKRLVYEYTKNGIGIIMDVVYNHVYKAEESPFEYLVPGYYFRYDGLNLSNGSGCGNELNTKRYMVRKFIIDSVSYYASQFKVSGFRFDLMGLIDIDTMNLVKSNLKKINPNITVYGEPWMGGLSTLSYDESSTKNNLEKLDVGYFNDTIRDAIIKGGFSNDSYCGYADAVYASDNDIYNLINGIRGMNGAINYASCHDNYALRDRIIAAGINSNILNIARLANSLVLTSKGSAFIYSGEEMLRGKDGNSNSYNAPYMTNAIDYSLKEKNIELFNSYKKLIYLHHRGIFNDISVVNVSDDHSLITYESGEYKIIHNSYSDSHMLDMSGYDLVYDSHERTDNKILPYETIILIKNVEKDDDKREAGVLMHITSLPAKYGIGTLGAEAFSFVDFIKDCGIKIWQILPLVPTNYGDSPYQSVSSTALNYYMIDFDILKDKGLLKESDYKDIKWSYIDTKVEFEIMFKEKIKVLKKAFENFTITDEFTRFEDSGLYKDFAVFMAIKEAHEYKEWESWGDKYQKYSKAIYCDAIEEFRDSYMFWVWTQYEFIDEWNRLHKYATENGISIMGDMPYYVAYDSVEVWKNPMMFDLSNVGGCPPDAFSSDGQLWGNPCFNWEYMRRDNYSWYSSRIRSAFEFIDILRIDHFRGFDRYYAIPKGAKDAKIGNWLDGPKFELFLDKRNMRIVAEDLGIIDDGVISLMEHTKYPGMRVFQFGLYDNDLDINKPHNYKPNTIGYSGTHDNMPNIEYLSEMDKDSKEIAYEVIRKEAGVMPKDDMDALMLMNEAIFKSKSNLVVIPMQDLVMSGKGSRMNRPSTISTDNWSYRIDKSALNNNLKNYIKKLVRLGLR